MFVYLSVLESGDRYVCASRKTGTPIRWPGVKGQNFLCCRPFSFYDAPRHKNRLVCEARMDLLFPFKSLFFVIPRKDGIFLFSMPIPVAAKVTQPGFQSNLASCWTRASHPSGSSRWAVPQRGITPGPDSTESQKTVGSLSVSMSHGA